MPHYTQTADGYRLAYEKLEGQGIGIVFLCGLMSDMEGSKALALEAYAKKQGRPFLRFDYFGHGQSDGDFADGRIGMWHKDTLHILDAFTEGPQVLVGSSMGGWQMLLAALARSEKTHACVGIAAAPDFTRELMWAQASDAQKAELKEKGIIEIPSDYGDEPYRIRYDFITESDNHMLFGKEIWDIHCPLRLLHGMQDPDVPWQFAPRIAEKVTSHDALVHLIKDGDHRLSREQDLTLLINTVDALV